MEVISLLTGELIKSLMMGEMRLNNKRYYDLSVVRLSLSFPAPDDCHAPQLLYFSKPAYVAHIKWFTKIPLLSS